MQVALDDETIEVQNQDPLPDVFVDTDISTTPELTLSSILVSSISASPVPIGSAHGQSVSSILNTV